MKYARLFSLVILTVFWASAGAQTLPQFNIVKPSTTGVPGEEVRVMKFDPAGNLWIAGRFYFWGEAALGMLSADQLDYQPLPGGGFDTGAWRVWSSVHHPIPSPYINDMVFGTGGVIWIASDGGLTRFDPAAPTEEQRWFTYTPANSPLILNDVRSLALDSHGNLWLTNVSVQMSNGALFRFNPTSNVWTQYRVGQELPWSPPWYNINAVMVSADDRVWLTHSTLGGMAEFNGTSWVLHDSPYQMEAMLADIQGNIWVRTSQYGLFKWNGSSWQNWPTVGGTITMTGLGTDRDGVVYVSTWYGGVYKMINDNPVFFVDADNIPRPVIGRPNGDIWINNYGGNATLGTVRHYTASGQLLSRMQTFNSGLPDYFVDRITHDSAGNMWFATGEAGLSRMLGSNGAPDAATHWRNWGNHNDLSEPYPWAGNEPMYSVFEDTGGIFWMGGNGVGRWNSATGQFTGFWNWQNSNLDSSGHYAITKRSGTMWVGSGGSGVYWFDGINWNHVTLSPGGYTYPPNNVRSMTVDTNNNLWVASEYGLRKFEAGNNTTFTLYDTSNTPLTSAGMTDVEADPNGGIWVGTYEGFARFDGTTWTLYNQANTGMPGTVVADVARRSSDGLIAIASNQGSTWPYTGGVSTFNGTTWTHYTPENSPLTHWQVVAVEFDGNGNLWASAMSEGVVQIMTGEPTGTPTPTPTPTATPTPTPTATPPPTPTPTPTPSPSPTPTPPPPTPTATPTSTPSPTPPPPTPTATPTPNPTATPTPTATPSPSATATPTPSPTPTPSTTPSPTPTPTPTPAIASPYDFNRDGKPDFVLYNASTRRSAIWYMNNNVQIGGAFGPILPAGWSLIDVADFNRDGNNDYALFNPSTRQTAIWYLSGNALTGGAWGPTLPSGWALVAIGDFNNDSKPDYVLYKASTRQTGVWYLNNNVYAGGAYGPTLPAGWRLAGVADFNGNGKTDYALFNPSTRQSGIYYLSGTVYVSSAFGPTIAIGYELMGTADFNGNGKPDDVLYNAATRRTALYYLNNNVYVGSAMGPALPAGWNLVAP